MGEPKDGPLIPEELFSAWLLETLRQGRSEKRLPGCPPETLWLQIASASLNSEETAVLLSHAAECDLCGRLLGEANDDLNCELTPEEQQLVTGLRSAKPKVQLALANRLAAESRRPSAVRIRWVYAVAASVFLAAGCGIVYWQWSHAPRRLLAMAYAERRIMEMRIPDANYGVMRTERSSGASRQPVPAALREAEGTILRNLASTPDDPEWLEEKARADLLDFDYPSAMADASRALAAKPRWDAALVDLAAAYFQRAGAEASPDDYGRAVEELSVLLGTAPDHRVALFNRAIAYERLMMYHEAVADWDHYLRLDGASDWSGEARSRRDAVQKLLISREKGHAAAPIVEPSIFQVLADRHPGEADRDIETYLDWAISTWLPLAAATPGNPAAQSALQSLGRLLDARHQDVWLNQVLAVPRSAKLGEASAALAAAIDADAGRDLQLGQHQAIQSQSLFRSAGNPAGAFRAGVELVYALQRSGQPRACLERSEELLNTARSQHYRWAEGQLGIERAICLDALGRKGLALESIHTALAMLGTAGYPVLRLRALGMAAAIENSSEHHRAAWALNTEGLKLFWSGSYPPIRAQQFYNSLSRAAADTGLVWVVVAFAREASRAAVLSANPTVVATARFWLGKDATLAGLSAEAHRELSAADLLFDKLPHTAATEYYRTECRIGLAELAVKDGRFAESEEYLRKARARLHEIDNSVMIGRYFGVASQLYQRSGNAGLAERAARSRVAVAELALQSLHDMKDRLMWSREMGDSYYALADFEWRRQLSGDTALAILEGYRGAAFRTHSGPPLKPDFASLEVAPPEPQVVGMGQFGKASSGQTLLVYAMLPGGLTAWVSANGGTWSTRIQVEPDKLRHLAAGFRDHCADRTFPQSGLRSEARQLYRILIEPVVGHLPETGPLLIDPEPAIAGIPFPALLSVSGEYFGNRHTVSLAPGAPYYRGLRAAAPILPESPVLVVGSPAAAGGSGGFRSALPDADREVRSAASHFRNSTILSGREATTAAIEREMARNFVFHFAGHSVANGVRVGLPLAPNQVGGGYEENVMSADSITPQLLANCRLAVFSACATEGLENSAAADPESLVFAFLRSGVPQVIATRWNIDSAATATFMAAFYEALTMGKAVDVALEAAAASIRTRAETSHPYYWAGFRLYGKIS